MSGTVAREDANGVCTLTLERPDKRNALTTAMFVALDGHLAALETQGDTVGCVVLRGAGASFCAGADIAAMQRSQTAPDPRFKSRVIERLSALPQPVVAAVQGHCFTGGLELALAADFILAAPDAHFADTHGRWGLVAGWGMSQRLPRRIGVAQAKRMMFTAAVIDATEAQRIGLVDDCGELASLVAEWAQRIVGNARHTNAMTKRLLRETEGMALDAGLAHEFFRNPGPAPDLQQRLARFARDATGR